MVVAYQEPMVLATIISPDDYVGEIISLIMVGAISEITMSVHRMLF